MIESLDGEELVKCFHPRKRSPDEEHAKCLFLQERSLGVRKTRRRCGEAVGTGFLCEEDEKWAR
jgi:hypothetical protein